MQNVPIAFYGGNKKPLGTDMQLSGIDVFYLLL
jgi:hypothetical protein